MTRLYVTTRKFLDDKKQPKTEDIITEVPCMRTIGNYHETVPDEIRKEVANELPSAVQPNQTLSIKEIIQKYVRNEPLSTSTFVGVDDEHGDLSPFTPRMPPIDIVVKAQEIQNVIQEGDRIVERYREERLELERQQQEQEQEQGVEQQSVEQHLDLNSLKQAIAIAEVLKKT